MESHPGPPGRRERTKEDRRRRITEAARILLPSAGFGV